MTVLLGAVALPTGSALQVSASGETAAASRLFAKTGLIVRADVAVDISLPRDWSDRARIGWGNPGELAVSIHVPRCGTAGDGWLAFAGGYYTATPACIPLTIRAAGRQAGARIGVGTTCAG
jgi:hypothetical protein